jgi:hypothetical protein
MIYTYRSRDQRPTQRDLPPHTRSIYSQVEAVPGQGCTLHVATQSLQNAGLLYE